MCALYSGSYKQKVKKIMVGYHMFESETFELNPPKQNEAKTRTKPKTSAALPTCTLRHCATEKLWRCSK